MASIDQIRDVIRKYLAEPNESEFLSAFSALSFNVHKHGDAAAVELANQVESCLADVRAGFRSMDALKRALHGLLEPTPVAYYYATAAVGGFSQSVNQLAVIERGFPAASSDTLPGVVFGSAIPVRA
jgi:hypothetical protein